MTVQQLKDYALVVGINTYADNNFLDQLNGPKNDARHFVDWLASPAGGTVPEGNVNPYVLISDDVGDKPKAGDIVEAVKKLLALSPNGETRIGRRLYIFLAGHGVGPDLDDAGLLTAEATEDAPAYIEGRRYANLLRGRALFDEIVLIMDCCRDFDGDLPESVFPFKPKVDPGGAHKVKIFYAYATGFGKAARERDFGAEVSGIFSHVVIEGLKGGAVDGEGRITGPSLERYVKRHVKEHLPPGTEQPSDIRFHADFVFADGLPPATVNATVEATVAHDKLVVLYGVGLKPVSSPSQNLGGGKFQIQLPIGKTYVFRLLDAGGAILNEDGIVVEHADEVINVKL